VLVLPLIGAIDARRATRIIEALLDGIDDHNAHVVIIDITGVPSVDTQVAHSLMQAARAARLLGTQTVLTGIRPEVAGIIVTLGVSLSNLVTRSNLQAGIEYALEVVERVS
jgi:rsbT co-antagonist protein RsbR